MAKQIIEEAFPSVNEVWGCEVPLYYPGLYAGTTDGAGLHLGEESILDYKQTNKPKKQEWITDYYLQLVAYALAHNEVHGTRIRKGVVLMCVRPEVDQQGNLISEPQYQEFRLEDKDFDHWEQQWWKRLELYYMTA
jgi:genome maintenance exonuclease 1